MYIIPCLDSMTRRTEHQQRSENLIKGFFQYCKASAKHLLQCARRQQHFLRHTGQPEDQDNGLELILNKLPDVATALDVDVTMTNFTQDSLDSAHSAASTSTNNSSESSGGDITFNDSSSSFTSLTSSFSLLFSDSEMDDMLELLPAGYPDSDDEDVGLDSESESWDIKDWEEDEGEIGGFEATPTETTTQLSCAVQEELADIYNGHYDKP